jgi:hypothetical protein
MSITSIVIVLLAIPLVLWALHVDRRRWTSKPSEELHGILASDDWKRWKLALKELRRRGEDTAVYIPQLIPRLLANSHTAREAARIILVNQFPELRQHLEAYRAADDVSVSRKKLAHLFEQYGVSQGEA